MTLYKQQMMSVSTDWHFSDLRCSSLMRTIMLRCPCEYCSMTSRTSYGFLAC